MVSQGKDGHFLNTINVTNNVQDNAAALSPAVNVVFVSGSYIGSSGIDKFYLKNFYRSKPTDNSLNKSQYATASFGFDDTIPGDFEQTAGGSETNTPGIIATAPLNLGPPTGP